MKKTTQIFLAIFFLSTYGFSQDKGYVAVSIGPSFPSGDFGSSDVNNPKSGFAATGATFDISFAYKLGQNFGLSALLRGQSNPVDEQGFLDGLQNVFPTVNWTIESNSWAIGGFMLGGYGSFPIGTGNSSFDIRGMIGYLSSSSPDMTVTGTQGTLTLWVNQNSASASSFAYLIGAGLKFNLGARICLLTNLDYMGSEPEFQNVKTTTNTGGYDVSTYTQSYGTINLGVGIGYRL